MRQAIVVILCCVFGACGAAADDAQSRESRDDLSLSAIHEPVFIESGCAAAECHASTLGTAEAVYALLVNAERSQPLCGRTHYVVPGDPEASVLWLLIRDATAEDAECGVPKMPSQRTEPMDPAVTQLVWDWIAAGANP